ncbi:hypothetical protein Pelo_11512 [Pelomyxa schiedti]|nr:hypothetical protein Pelo_11512 [Pelomyxa schiedti]
MGAGGVVHVSPHSVVGSSRHHFSDNTEEFPSHPSPPPPPPPPSQQHQTHNAPSSSSSRLPDHHPTIQTPPATSSFSHSPSSPQVSAPATTTTPATTTATATAASSSSVLVTTYTSTSTSSPAHVRAHARSPVQTTRRKAVRSLSPPKPGKAGRHHNSPPSAAADIPDLCTIVISPAPQRRQPPAMPEPHRHSPPKIGGGGSPSPSPSAQGHAHGSPPSSAAHSHGSANAEPVVPVAVTATNPSGITSAVTSTTSGGNGKDTRDSSSPVNGATATATATATGTATADGDPTSPPPGRYLPNANSHPSVQASSSLWKSRNAPGGSHSATPAHSSPSATHSPHFHSPHRSPHSATASTARHSGGAGPINGTGTTVPGVAQDNLISGSSQPPSFTSEIHVDSISFFGAPVTYTPVSPPGIHYTPSPAKGSSGASASASAGVCSGVVEVVSTSSDIPHVTSHAISDNLPKSSGEASSGISSKSTRLVIVSSCAFKCGGSPWPPEQTDIFWDVRTYKNKDITNPWDHIPWKHKKISSIRDVAIRQLLWSLPDVQSSYNDLHAMVTELMKTTTKNELHVAIMCRGGKQRSVAFVERLYKDLGAKHHKQINMAAATTEATTTSSDVSHSTTASTPTTPVTPPLQLLHPINKESESTPPSTSVPTTPSTTENADGSNILESWIVKRQHPHLGHWKKPPHLVWQRWKMETWQDITDEPHLEEHFQEFLDDAEKYLYRSPKRLYDFTHMLVTSLADNHTRQLRCTTR